MLILAIENFLFFSTLFALGGLLLAWAARSAAHHSWWRTQPATLTRFYTFALVAPPLAALWLVVASFLPAALLGGAAFDTAHATPHELHLFGLFTSQFEPMLARATLLFAAAAAAFALWSSVRAHRRIGDIIGRLGMSAEQSPSPQQVALVREVAMRHNLDVGLVVSDYPLSFVWGYSRSKLLLSLNLLNILTPEELAGVLEHEAAHHARRDNFVKLLLTVCSRLSLIFPLMRIVLRWRNEQVELICDEVAASLTASPLEIADALVKVRRHSATFSHHAAPPLVAPGTSGFTADASSFERRVLRLLALADAPPPRARAIALSQPPTTVALTVILIFAITLALLSLLAPLTVHTAAESVIQIIR